MPCEVRITRLASTQVAGLRGKALAAFDAFKLDLAQRGCEALGYRVTGDVVERLCVKHLRGLDRALVAFPEPEVATIVLVGPHTSDPQSNVYDLLYRVAGLEGEPPERRTKPACCEADGTPPAADDEFIDRLTRHTRGLLGRPR